MRLTKSKPRMSVLLLKVIAGIAMLIQQVTAATSHMGLDPAQVVWEPQPSKGHRSVWLRDPTIFRFAEQSYVLSGTRPFIIEYPGIESDQLVKSKGRPYKLQILSVDKTRVLRDHGFPEWGKSFVRTPAGLFMLASLPGAVDGDYNHGTRTDRRKRSLFVFEPTGLGPTTAGGFPLQWRLTSNKPLLQGIYSARVFQDHDQFKYLLYDARQDDALKTTCIMASRLSDEWILDQAHVLLCPGRALDASTWDKNLPFASEVRFEDSGGLVEGGWLFRAASDNYYLMYSSGDYASTDNYGGFVASCDSPLGPCEKILTSKQQEVKPLLAGSTKQFEKIGRPYPVVNQQGKLHSIIFHARARGSRQDWILRCRNSNIDMLEQFISEGKACQID